jgi:hypothetical protein
MTAPAVSERCRCPTIYVVQPPTEQWESLVDEIDYDWRDICLAREPRLDRMPIARFDIEQVTRKERTHVRVD